MQKKLFAAALVTCFCLLPAGAMDMLLTLRLHFPICMLPAPVFSLQNCQPVDNI